MRKRNFIDISTEEKKKEVFKKFDSFTSKNQAHYYFGISDNKQGAEYLKEIALLVGFDLGIYKERQKKPIRYCKQCGKEITSKWGKDFCSKSCANSYNNKKRDRESYKKLGSNFLKKEIQKEKKYCIICGKELEGCQTKYCSISCRNRGKYLTEGDELICQECGRVFRSRGNRRFCSNECSAKNRTKEYVNQWLNGKVEISPNQKLPKSIREFLLGKVNYKCEECGFEGYNKVTNNTILQIHHIDGNSGNNVIENLKVLCPNCHAMTENYMALNKGKSARNKRYEKRRE